VSVVIPCNTLQTGVHCTACLVILHSVIFIVSKWLFVSLIFVTALTATYLLLLHKKSRGRPVRLARPRALIHRQLVTPHYSLYQ